MNKPEIHITKKKMIVRWTYCVPKCEICGGYLDFPNNNEVTAYQRSISTDVFIEGKRGYHMSCFHKKNHIEQKV